MANLSSSGARAFTLQDVIGIINDNANAANSPSETSTEVSNQLAVAQDDLVLTDVGTATSGSPTSTYNTGSYGFGSYG